MISGYFGKSFQLDATVPWAPGFLGHRVFELNARVFVGPKMWGWVFSVPRLVFSCPEVSFFPCLGFQFSGSNFGFPESRNPEPASTYALGGRVVPVGSYWLVCSFRTWTEDGIHTGHSTS